MKLSLFLIPLITLTSLIAQAHASAPISQKDAKALFDSISSIAEPDCGEGTCDAELDTLDCTMTGNSVDERKYFCTYADENQKQQATTSEQAKKLFSALSDAGVFVDSGMGTSEIGGLVSVKCTGTGLSVNKPSYSCTYNQISNED